MGIFDQQQNPFVQSASSFAPVHTGTIFDPLGALGAQLQSRNNDRVKAQLETQAKADAITRADSLSAQSLQNKQDAAVLANTNKVTAAKVASDSAIRVQAAKDAKALEKATSKANAKYNLLNKQQRVDPANKAEFIQAEIAGATGTVKSSSLGSDIANTQHDIAVRAETKTSRAKTQSEIDANVKANNISSMLLAAFEVKDSSGNVIGVNNSISGGAAGLAQFLARAGIQADELRKSAVGDFFKNKNATSDIAKPDRFNLNAALIKKSGIDAQLVMIAYMNARAANGPGVLSKTDVQPHLDAVSGWLSSGNDIIGYLRSNIIINNDNIRLGRAALSGAQGDVQTLHPFIGQNNPNQAGVNQATSLPPQVNISGKIYSFPDQVSADAFKAAMGVK